MIILALIVGIAIGFALGLYACGKVVADYRHQINQQAAALTALERLYNGRGCTIDMLMQDVKQRQQNAADWASREQARHNGSGWQP